MVTELETMADKAVAICVEANGPLMREVRREMDPIPGTLRKVALRVRALRHAVNEEKARMAGVPQVAHTREVKCVDGKWLVGQGWITRKDS